MVEPLEERALFSGALRGVVSVQASETTPQILRLYVSGSVWTAAFQQYISQYYPGFPDPYYGVRVDGQVATLAWMNLDRVTVQFSQNVHVEPDDLLLRGVNTPVYSSTAVEATFDELNGVATATWTLDKPISVDRLIVEVDGDPGGVRERSLGTLLDGDGDGNPGGDYRLRLNVFPGNVQGGEAVDSKDIMAVRSALHTDVVHVGVGNASYTKDRDVNGDGRINAVDVAEVRQRYLTHLPYIEPTVAAAGASVRIRPGARGLFSSTPVLE